MCFKTEHIQAVYYTIYLYILFQYTRSENQESKRKVKKVEKEKDRNEIIS